MKIMKNSWHYKLYSKIYDLEVAPPPNNLCLYFWESILAMILSVLIVIFKSIWVIIKSVYRILLIPINLFVELLIGFYLKGYFQKRVALFKVSGIKFYPYQLIAIFAISIFYGEKIISILYQNYLYIFGTIISLFIIYIGIWSIYCVVNKTRRTETWHLIKAYLKAKKQKICPFVEYE